MLRVSEMPEFDYYAERGAFREVRHPLINDPFLVDATTIRAERLPDAPLNPAPMPGEHSIAIVKERLGLGAEEIDALIAAGALEQYGPKA